MGIAVAAVVALLALLLLTLVVIGLGNAVRGTPITHVCARGDPDGPPGVCDPLFLHTIEELTAARVRDGHEVELLLNGDATYPRLFADLRAARRLIVLHIYYMGPGRLADELAAALADRARAGVPVFVLYDVVGSTLPDEYFEELCRAGVEVAAFRPIRPHRLHVAMHRAHARVVVIDGAVGYTGGFGIDDKWLGDGRHEGQWRDTNVRVVGPAVAALQATFVAFWAEATGELLTGRLFFTEEGPPRGDGKRAGLVNATPVVGSTPAERLVALSLAAARRRIWITNPYFVPDDDFRRLLVEAVERGVDVRVLTASHHTDVKLTRWAGRAAYDQLLGGGVRIFEYQPAMIHAKTMVIDGAWCSVGTINADNRSMAFNNEVSIVVLDAETAGRLEAAFEADLDLSCEITAADFARRGLGARVVEKAACQLQRIL